jgi:DNA-directed RNA polymerase subunit RPC12/RpoP
MERSISSFKFENDSYKLSPPRENSKCHTCGEEFETPLFAVISSGFLVEEYYACPRCLSKVGGVERQKHAEVHEAEDEEDSHETEVEDKMEETVTCAHHLGYLKRRPKNTPIPEECLTCSKMIDCMSY